ncbi:MAG: UDP-glucose 4-epimerase GalE [Candidatus Moraniibacteriota bacterium]|nr:MAG: UDP-glucose 4-epimerase GalE [Candidatus Moranbacteria bacterium]
MKNILVTGGAGFIGSHTVIELAQAGYNPVILDNFSNSDPRILLGIEKILGRKPLFYKGDCLDDIFLSKIFSLYHFSGIIHFAAFKSVSESIKNPLLYWKNNIDSLLHILEIALKKNVSAFVFSSSATIYGEPNEVPISEVSPRKLATCAYGATKQAGEDILQNICTTPANKKILKGISLRYFNPVGAHPSGLIGELPLGIPQNLIPFVTQTAAKIRKELIIFGNDYPTPDGTCLRDYIHVVDLAKAHISALTFLLKDNAPQYDVFNIGNGKASSVLEVIHTFQKITNVSLPYRIGPRREGDVVSCYAEVSKAEKILNWKAEYTLENALRDAWNWQKNIPF